MKKKPPVHLVAIQLGSSYGVVQGQLLRFDPAFSISIAVHDGRQHIQINLSNDHIAGFFGDKIDYMTAIVGKNGVGKSTTLKYIKELFIKENRELDSRDGDVLLFREDRSLKIFMSSSRKNDYHIDNRSGFELQEIYYKNYPKVFDHIRNAATVFYSNSLETDFFEKESTNYFNISTGFLKANNGKINARIRSKKIRSLGGANRFKYTELKRQTDFLNAIETTDHKLDIPFKRIDQIILDNRPLTDKDYEKFITVNFEKKNPGDKDKDSEEARRFMEIRERVIKVVKEIENHFGDRRRNDTGTGLFIAVFYENLTLQLLRLLFEEKSLRNTIDTDPGFAFELLDMFTEEMSHGDNHNRYERFLQRLKDFIAKEQKFGDNYERRQLPRKQNPMVEKVDFFEKLESFFKRNWTNFNYDKLSIRLDTKSALFTELFEDHYGTLLELPFFNLHWPSLSAGEESLIAYFSRLYSVFRDIRQDNVLMLIDEGDLYFHPEWQRDYIYFLLAFLNSSLLDDINVQVIITTHSPFIISDLPKENIILMVKENGVSRIVDLEEDTFGGNIHTLFTQAFFLGDSLTSKFAKAKINTEIIQPVQSFERLTDPDTVEQLIRRVGEPVLRSILQERFNSKQNG